MSRSYKSMKKPVKVLSEITCNCCKKAIKADNIFEIQDIIHIELTGGYGSKFGDGIKVSADFCAECSQELFGKYLDEQNIYE